LQDELSALNTDWLDLDAAEAPDGDADLEGADFSSFVIPPCRRCGGLLKPDVVFFGENVPRDRVDAAFRHLDDADAMLIVGSSLMVYSGFRFVERAVSLGKPGRHQSILAEPGPTRSLRLKRRSRASPRSLSFWAREPRQVRSSLLT
jgi:NAD-dependent SIR2 family protein deacetylase